MKSNFKTINIDLYSMSKNIININNKKNLIKKKFNKSLFTLGFDPGFTKNLIRANYVNVYRKNEIKKQNKIKLIFNKSNYKK